MRRKVLVALASSLFFYALSDILLWQRIFEAHDLYLYDDAYQTGHVSILVGLIAVGIVLLFDTGIWALWYGLALYTLSYSGLEDVLYYWLDGNAIPATLPWLDSFHNLILFKPVTNTSLILSSATWIVLWLGVLSMSNSTLRHIPRMWRN
jgi:hypothetical protein